MDVERTLLDGIGHHKAGRVVDAHRAYKAVLAEHPDEADALHLLGMLVYAGGNAAKAAELIGRAAELRPNTFDFQLHLSRVNRALGRRDAAVDGLRRAVALHPSPPLEVVVELARLLATDGHAAEAVGVLEPAVQRQPTGEGLAALAELYLAVGRTPDALRAATAAVKLLPDAAAVHGVLGLVLERQGDAGPAASAYRRALAIEPDLAEAHNNLGHALLGLGQTDEATTHLRRAVALRPTFPAAHANLAAALATGDHLDDALASYRTALEQAPSSANTWAALCKLLVATRQWAAAVAASKRLVALRESAGAYADLGTACAGQEQLDDAIAATRRAIELDGDDVAVRTTLAHLLRWSGQLPPAIAAYRDAMAVDPRAHAAHSGLCYTLLMDDSTPPATAFAEHVEWGRRHADPVAELPAWRGDRSPDRRLRVGYVSPNFRNQAVMSFVLPVLRNHDRAGFEVFCYSDAVVSDDVTKQVRVSTDHFRRTGELSDAGLAKMIRADGIDVLVELTGHIGGGRLLSLARRPAPVQVSYIGYQGTTGVGAVDYVLTDEFTDPPGAERGYVERPWRLPTSYFCYDPPNDAPPVRPLPAAITGRVTFGCMNQVSKATPTAVRLWGRVLAATPGSRMVLLTTRCKVTNDRILADFKAAGVSADRVQLLYRTGVYEYLERYNGIDVALDPAPFVGHTTTCDAAWMGCPTVTLAGTGYAHRYGGVVGRLLGLASLVVEDEDAYVAAAVELAGDRDRLGKVRAGLREAMRRSPVCDAAGFTRELEAAYRAMWQARVERV